MDDRRDFVMTLIGDGRSLIALSGLCLAFSGLFAFFLSATGHFLPHDVQFLGMTAEELCGLQQCRIVHFMFHDRASFGGALVAIGTLYLWLAEFPLRARQAWAWWALACSGMLGFGSFLAYLEYGYLDTWHGIATAALLPCFALGLARSRRTLLGQRRPASLLHATPTDWRSPLGIGKACLLFVAFGLTAAGATIFVVGATTVFVPQDLTFMGLETTDLQAINTRLIPLIAHDRAGFGGGVCTFGVLTFFCVWYGPPCRSLWQALCIAGCAAFIPAIGVHPLIGYTDPVHLAPAILGAIFLIAGLALTFRPMVLGSVEKTAERIGIDRAGV